MINLYIKSGCMRQHNPKSNLKRSIPSYQNSCLQHRVSQKRRKNFDTLVGKSNGISSPVEPFTTYKHSIELRENVADLWWTVNDDKQEILFELHVKTTGWIALGISPDGAMIGADIGTGWVDKIGNVHFQDRYAYAFARPIIDNTTQDWFHLQGREQNGWTSIQFKRLLDTSDPMDVPIMSGITNVIFAYGLVDADLSRPNGDISSHGPRRGVLKIPLHS
ncbi:unnamed protein product [Rotaria socialis]